MVHLLYFFLLIAFAVFIVVKRLACLSSGSVAHAKSSDNFSWQVTDIDQMFGF